MYLDPVRPAHVSGAFGEKLLEMNIRLLGGGDNDDDGGGDDD